MQNNEPLMDFSTYVQDIAAILQDPDVDCIEVSESLFVYLTYFLRDTIEYEKGQMYPIGYLYGVPVKINSEFKGFEWEVKKKRRVR